MKLWSAAVLSLEKSDILSFGKFKKSRQHLQNRLQQICFRIPNQSRVFNDPDEQRQQQRSGKKRGGSIYPSKVKIPLTETRVCAFCIYFDNESSGKEVTLYHAIPSFHLIALKNTVGKGGNTSKRHFLFSLCCVPFQSQNSTI